MLRFLSVLSLPLLATPAAAHTGDHSHIGVVDGIVHGLVEHGALIGAAVVLVVAVAFAIKRFR
jgi:hypothetical protein